jgi:hypothetical protein
MEPPAAGTNVVYVGSGSCLWGYLAAIHEAFRAVGRPTSHGSVHGVRQLEVPGIGGSVSVDHH